MRVSSVCEEKGRGKGRGKEQDKTRIINVHCENCAHTSLLPAEVCPPDAAGNKVGYDPVTITRKGAKSSMRYDLIMNMENSELTLSYINKFGLLKLTWILMSIGYTKI